MPLTLDGGTVCRPEAESLRRWVESVSAGLVVPRRPRKRRRDGVAPYSFREAAALLHLDRHTTVLALVKSGQLRTVQWGREVRIPRQEVERVAREGFSLGGRRALQRPPKRPRLKAQDLEAQIRALPYGRKKP